MYNFIVSDENISHVNDVCFSNHNIPYKKTDSINCSNKNSIKKKAPKKKSIKKKLLPMSSPNSFDCDIPPINTRNNFMIDDPEVDSFKKILAFESINANTINKIKPKIKKDWLSAITN